MRIAGDSMRPRSVWTANGSPFQRQCCGASDVARRKACTRPHMIHAAVKAGQHQCVCSDDCNEMRGCHRESTAMPTKCEAARRSPEGGPPERSAARGITSTNKHAATVAGAAPAGLVARQGEDHDRRGVRRKSGDAAGRGGYTRRPHARRRHPTSNPRPPPLPRRVAHAPLIHHTAAAPTLASASTPAPPTAWACIAPQHQRDSSQAWDHASPKAGPGSEVKLDASWFDTTTATRRSEPPSTSPAELRDDPNALARVTFKVRRCPRHCRQRAVCDLEFETPAPKRETTLL